MTGAFGVQRSGFSGALSRYDSFAGLRSKIENEDEGDCHRTPNADAER
jgi:hypothetical protein